MGANLYTLEAVSRHMKPGRGFPEAWGAYTPKTWLFFWGQEKPPDALSAHGMRRSKTVPDSTPKPNPMKKTLRELLGEETTHLEGTWRALAPHLGLGPPPKRLRGPVVLGVREGFPYPYRLVFGRGGGLVRLQVVFPKGNLRLDRDSPPEALAKLSLPEGVRLLWDYAPALEALGLLGAWKRQALLALLRAKPQGEAFRFGRAYHLLRPKGGGWLHGVADPGGPWVRVESLPLEGVFPLLEPHLAQGRFPATPRHLPVVALLRDGLEAGWEEEELQEGLLALRAWSDRLLEAYRGLLNRIPPKAFPQALPDGRATMGRLGNPIPAEERREPGLAFRETWDLYLLDLPPLPFDPFEYAPRPIHHEGRLFFYGPGWWGWEAPDEGVSPAAPHPK